jgi:hypothetical protein
MNAGSWTLLVLLSLGAGYLSHVTFTPLLSVAFVAFILLFWLVVVAWHITEGS